MSRITVSGVLPAIIVENSTSQGWVGSLALTGDLASIASLELVGAGASYFSASFDLVHAMAVIRPAARADYEAFRGPGLTPELDFSLVVNFTDGSSETDPTQRQIAIQNLDDTPPSALSFSSGGTVTAGDIGAVVGTLRVTDVETSGPFYFSFADSDAWKFEVVGTTLKLKDGYSFGLDDVGTLSLPVLVSDGTQSAGFALNITINAPGGQPDLLHLLAPGELIDNFWYDSAIRVSSTHCKWNVTHVEDYGQGVRALLLNDGATIWLPPYVQELKFSDGWMDFRPNGSAAIVMALYHTILQRDPDPAGYYNNVNLLETGTKTALSLTSAMLKSPEYKARIGTPDDVTFITGLYHDALGRTPDAAGLAFQLSRLASGVTRTQMVDDFALSPEGLGRLEAQHEDGFWVPYVYGQEVAMIYQVALGRDPDPAGLVNWVGQLQSGKLTVPQLATKIGKSKEFSTHYASYSDADFVTAMYENALHRAPDAAGFAYWTAQLASHAISRYDLVSGFALSPENYANYGQHPIGLDLYHL